MTASASSTAYKPVLPLDVHSSSVLSQDIITSASILVDSTSPAPVAAFTNPFGGEAEALAVVNKQVCHITRDRQTDGGWRAVPLFGGQAAEQVAAGISFQSTAYGFFIDDGGQLHSTTLGADGKTWSQPVAVPDGLMSHPRVAYTGNRALVIYGVSTKGDLVTARQIGITDPFTATVHPVQSALAGDDFKLCMLDENAFTILANVEAKAYTITGDIRQPDVVGPAPAPQFTETLKHVALGFASPVGLSPTAIFMLVAEDKANQSSALHCWSQAAGSEAKVQKVADRSITLATGHVSLDTSLHVYAIDDQLGLWVLHQHPRHPWRDGAPNWAPFLPLDKGIGHVASDMNPAAAPSLFALDGGDFSLRLHELDAGSRMWKTRKVLQHKAEAFEVTRHRAEVQILDAHARALPNQAVNVAVEKGSSAVEVWAGGRLHLVDEKGATINTDITGKLTVAIIATENGLACPNLVVSCEGLPTAKTIRPAGGLHEYLSGKGTLNPTNPSDRGGGPLPQFGSDGGTLKTAKVNGKLLAPGASDPKSDSGTAANVAGAIQKGAEFALGNTPPDVTGFGGSLVKGHTSFQVFHSDDKLRRHREEVGFTELGGFWDDIKDFFGDIFEGIKNFVIKVAHFVVHVAEKIVDFTLDMAEFAGKLLHLDISGIEKAASFMHGFFNSVDADIDKVVEWLKALFDFGSIWRTKKAIQQGVESLPPYVVNLAAKTQHAVDGWFAKQKAEVNAAFDAMKAKYEGQTYSQLGHWQDPCAPPSSKPVVGNAAPSDFTSNPHHNWLHDKVTSYSPDTSGLKLDSSVDALWATVASHFAESGEEFQKALGKFREAVWTTISDPTSFATKAVPDMIEMMRDVTLAVLDLLDAIVDSVAALIGTGVDLLDKLLKAELPLGFLNTLWRWMAEGAGYPDDATLNIYALGSLSAALPCTLIYKLVEGVDHEPFPDGKLPAPLHVPMAAQIGIQMPKNCITASNIIKTIQVIPAGAADFLAQATPGWLTGINVVFSGTVWVLRHGYPQAWPEILGGLVISGAVFGHFIPDAIAKWKSFDEAEQNDIVAGLSTAFGLAFLGYGIYLDKTEQQTPGLAIANILTPLPMVFSWLTLSSIRENADLAPLAIMGNLLFDAVGYIGGGIELQLDTQQLKS